MGQTIQADENGALVVSSGLLGRVEPGTRFEVERWWASTTPAQRVAWLREWIASLPSSPPIPLEATRRDSMYD
jgi:hypothetical protein